MTLVAQREENEEQMEVWQSGKVRLRAELLERDQGVTILLEDQGKARCEAKWNNLKEFKRLVRGRDEDSTAYY